MVIAIGIGVPFTRVLGGTVSDFRARVIADGGTFEAYACMSAQINALKAINLYPVGDAVMQALQTRIATDSGTFEAYNCGAIAIQELADINL